MNDETCHIPVLRDEVLEYLRAPEGGEFLDCTLGGAGHTQGVLEACSSSRVVAVDRDRRAIQRAEINLQQYHSRLELIHCSFSQMGSHLQRRKFSGVLADFGLSSDQLGENRGFSFNDSGPLDMRMDETDGVTAAQIVNDMGAHELFVVLKKGGVGKEAKSVARAIINARPIKTAQELSTAVNKKLAGKFTSKKVNPATIIFQAIRMEVNQEKSQIEDLLDIMPGIIEEQGRFVAISFHSLEDKIVASRMRKWERPGDLPALWPGTEQQGSRSQGRFLTSKAVFPGAEEIDRNPRARSARLRVFEFSARD